MTEHQPTRAFMDRTYPGWDAAIHGMVSLAAHHIEHGVLSATQKNETALLCAYEELYLAVTNVTPNKPPLMVGGKELVV